MISAVNGVKSGFFALFIAVITLSFSSYHSVAQTENRTQSAVSSSQKSSAVLIIRFNQKYVYFENALKKVVDKVYAIKPNATYEIQSIIPHNGNDADARKYLDNLRSVVAEFNRLGISKDRISIRTDVTDLVDSQEVSIFVR